MFGIFKQNVTWSGISNAFIFFPRVFFIPTVSKVYYFNNHNELRAKDNDSKVSLRIIGSLCSGRYEGPS